jgi:hypothetical protein
VKEYSKRSEALVQSKETDKEKSSILYQEKTTKKMLDLLYSDDPTDLSDSNLNKLDTTNFTYNSQIGRPSHLISSKHKIEPHFTSIKEQIDSKDADFLLQVYRIVTRKRFVIGSKKIEGLEEMLPSDSDDEEMQENNRHRKIKLGDREESEEEEDEHVKPHMRNVLSKEEMMKLRKREEFIGEGHGLFKKGTYLRIEVEIDKKVATLLDPQKVVTL